VIVFGKKYGKINQELKRIDLNRRTVENKQITSGHKGMSWKEILSRIFLMSAIYPVSD
jgi:hypothetical protein